MVAICSLLISYHPLKFSQRDGPRIPLQALWGRNSPLFPLNTGFMRFLRKAEKYLRNSPLVRKKFNNLAKFFAEKAAGTVLE
jgi:hypothetical protein